MLLRACRQLENGCVVYVAFSINYPERKANPQFVRGALIVGGWLIKPVEGVLQFPISSLTVHTFFSSLFFVCLSSCPSRPLNV